MKAVVAAFNQEKALVGAFSVITNLRMQLFEALVEDVYTEIENCCRALSERLDNSLYFFGKRPTELDALVFGHIFSILTTPLPDNRAKNIVQQFGNLIKLCENIERDYFEKLNSSDSDNGNFVKLP